MAEAFSANKKHSISVTGRSEISVTGVEDVISFDESCVVMKTVCGILSLDGEDLRVVALKTGDGEVEVTGTVNGIIYPESTGKVRGIFGRRSRKKDV